MPKKKLTKAQVKRKFKTMFAGVYDLTLDKMAYGSKSFNTMSDEKSRKMLDDINRARVRLEKR